MTTQIAPDACQIADSGLDDFEIGLLPVLRHLWQGFATPAGQGWLRAQIIAAERWGEPLGLIACYRLQGFLRSLLACREDGLIIHDPLDANQRGLLSHDEEQALTLLHHMRRHQTPEARRCLARLTGGEMDPYVIRDGLHLAARFPAGQTGERPCFEPPRLRVVG